MKKLLLALALGLALAGCGPEPVQDLNDGIDPCLLDVECNPWLDPPYSDVLTVPLEPCVNEDGPGPCYWDAKEFGNHVGDSYILLADGTQVMLP
jgi:hypothetical protein